MVTLVFLDNHYRMERAQNGPSSSALAGDLGGGQPSNSLPKMERTRDGSSSLASAAERGNEKEDAAIQADCLAEAAEGSRASMSLTVAEKTIRAQRADARNSPRAADPEAAGATKNGIPRWNDQSQQMAKAFSNADRIVREEMDTTEITPWNPTATTAGQEVTTSPRSARVW